VRQYLQTSGCPDASTGKQEEKVDLICRSLSGRQSSAQSFDPNTSVIQPAALQVPLCDRCHDLVYYSRGIPIAHPSVESLADSIDESPHRVNHIYHVLDAVDFPMSLIPSIYKHLSVAKPRTKNRRSQQSFSTLPSMSFIITRSDLLAPEKEMVDSLMPYFTSVLREALGRTGRDMRLGDVDLVSSKRGWWTRQIKETISKRGGGNWLVGKANVGKSNLFEVIFPKGSRGSPAYAELQGNGQEMSAKSRSDMPDNEPFSETSLLPPPQPDTPYPTLPLVSSLPGTTASPIRLPFGKGKGELIDLPGLARGNLEEFVSQDQRRHLVMATRPLVEQQTLKPGKSLVLGGGLIRITPVVDGPARELTFLAYPFVPLSSHVTSTAKAIAMQSQGRTHGVDSILAEGVGDEMASAGSFKLETDVTRARAAPILKAGVKLEQLPFRVFATDILIEGVGWVELVCQVRRRVRGSSPPKVPRSTEATEQDFTPFLPTLGFGDRELSNHLDDGNETLDPGSDEFEMPRVKVFSPNGNHVSQRKSMGVWLLINRGGITKRQRQAIQGAKPRKPMKGVKKRKRTMTRDRRSQIALADSDH